MIRLIIFFGSILVLSSCGSDIKMYPNVDPELWSHFETFEEEAFERGITIDLAELGITGIVEEIATQHVAGSCLYGSAGVNHVTIDATFWARSSPLQKEMVVFHELGHCALIRGHSEGILSTGACASIMRSGLGACIDNYTTSTRTFYIDELF